MSTYGVRVRFVESVIDIHDFITKNSRWLGQSRSNKRRAHRLRQRRMGKRRRSGRRDFLGPGC